MVNVVVSVVLVAIGLAATPELLVGFGVAAALGIALEVLAGDPDRPRRDRRTTVLDLSHALGDRAVIVPVVALALAVLDAVVPDGPTVHAAVVFVLADLANYGIHRALHRVPLLWRFHAVHHSSEHLDWLATSRVHPVDLAINITVVALPAQALGQPQLAPWLVTLLFVQPFLIHAAVRLRLRAASWVVVTPTFHHWHHAADAAAHDRNFGMFLSVWDRVFGTALDASTLPGAYGVPGSPLGAADYVGQLTIPFRPSRGRATAARTGASTSSTRSTTHSGPSARTACSSHPSPHLPGVSGRCQSTGRGEV